MTFHLPTVFANAGMLSSIWSVRYWNENNADVGTSPLTELGDPVQYPTDVGCRNADAGGISLDADAELCILSC
jgi:hypothetical protein